MAPAVGLGDVSTLLQVTYTFFHLSSQSKFRHTRTPLEPTLSLLFAGNSAGKSAVFDSRGRLATGEDLFWTGFAG
jgi:hypothetical protein